MTGIFYFSSTGNSLYIAKRIGDHFTEKVHYIPNYQGDTNLFKNIIIVIIRLSAKGTDGVMKPAVFRAFSKFVIIGTESSAYYRTRGGEWWGCIAATPHCYMVRSSVKASTIGANK